MVRHGINDFVTFLDPLLLLFRGREALLYLKTPVAVDDKVERLVLLIPLDLPQFQAVESRIGYG